VKSHNGKGEQRYASWNASLKDAESSAPHQFLEAIACESTATWLPLHTSADVEPANFEAKNFTIGKTPRRKGGRHFAQRGRAYGREDRIAS